MPRLSRCNSGDSEGCPRNCLAFRFSQKLRRTSLPFMYRFLGPGSIHFQTSRIVGPGRAKSFRGRHISMHVALRTIRSWSVLSLAAVCLIQSASASTSLHASFAAAQSVVPTGSLDYPYRVAIDSAGNVYISNTEAEEVLKETWSQATQTYTESVVVPASYGLTTPYGIAVDASGNVYVADNGHHRVVKSTPEAGSYTQSVVTTTTTLSFPTGLAVDSSGKLYIADTGNGEILIETPSGSNYTEQALTYSSNFAQITGIAVDSSGDIFVSDIGNMAVYEEASLLSGYKLNRISWLAWLGKSSRQSIF